jgi:cytoskeleton protein RodZ
MNADAPGSVGRTLRDAREAHGISIEDAAVRLRLMHRQIEAMEADDFASLGQPVFARGFVRNYARLLGMPPEPLLARMEGAPSEPAVANPAEVPPRRNWLTSPWVILMLLGALAVVVVPVALYWWLNSGADEEEGVGGPPVAGAAGPMAPAPPPARSGDGASVPEQLAVPPAATAAMAAMPAAAATPEPPAGSSALHFEFADEAWVEIRDGSGRMVHRQLNRPGSSLDVRGQPPFDLVVGNAAQVRMSYNGRLIDLRPFIDVTVARFTLEE